VLRSTNILANLTLAAWLLADVVRIAVAMEGLPGGLIDVLTCVGFVLAAIFVLARPPPIRQDVRVDSALIALAAALWPMLLVKLPASTPEPTTFVWVCQAVALAGLLVSILYLGRNFSLLPQYRDIVARGPYRLVRHPIYGCYLVFDATLVIQSASALAACLWLFEGLLFLARARREEQLLLASDAHYRAYVERVRYRLVPLIL